MSSFEEYMQDINFKSEHPELYDERKPKFKIGDVVFSYTEKYEKDIESFHYFIKEAILINNGNAPSEYMYEVAMTDNPDKIYRFKEDDLVLEYHDKKWEEYVTENARNANYSLPAWRGEIYNFMKLNLESDRRMYKNDTLPPERMEHILDKHSFYRRIDKLLKVPKMKDAILKRMNCNEDEVDEILNGIKWKIEYYNGMRSKDNLPGTRKGHDVSFNINENKLISVVDYVDKYLHLNDKNEITESKDHYPPYMSDYDIMKAIKEAYGNAEKVEIEKSPKGLQSKKIICQGKSNKGLNIHFHYNLDLRFIETAYPVIFGGIRSKKKNDD